MIVRLGGAALAAAIFFACTPAVARAQFGLVEGLFSNFTDIVLYATVSKFGPRWSSPNSVATERNGRAAFGIEMLFSAGEIQRRVGAEPDRDTTVFTPVEAVVQRRGNVVLDSTTTYRIETRRIAAPEQTIALFELAVGYSEAGFDLVVSPPDGVDADVWEVRGALRQLPSISFYANFMTENAVSPYIGLRSGLIHLSSLRAYGVDGSVLSGRAQAFQLGAVAGLAASPPPFDNVSLFVEFSTMRRRFASIEWSDDVPPTLPRDFRFGAFSFSAGVQVGFR